MGHRRCLEVRLGTTFSLKGLSTMSSSSHHHTSAAAQGNAADTLRSKSSRCDGGSLLLPESPLPSVRPTSVLRFGHEEFRADSHSVSGTRASWNHRCNFPLPANQNEYPKELQVEIWDSAAQPSRLLSSRAVDVSAVYDAARGSSMDALESLQGADGKTAGQIRLHVQLLQEDSFEDPTPASPPPLPPPQLVPATPLSSQRGARVHASGAGRRRSQGAPRTARKPQGRKGGRQQAQNSEATLANQGMPQNNVAAGSASQCLTGQQQGHAEHQQQQMWLKPQQSQNGNLPSPLKPLRLTLPPIFSNFPPVSSSAIARTTNVTTPKASLLVLPFGSANATTSPPSERTDSPFSATPIASQSQLPPSSLTPSPAASRSPSPSPPPASASPSPSPPPHRDTAITPNSSPYKTTPQLPLPLPQLAPSPVARVAEAPRLTDLLAAKPLPPLSLPAPRNSCGTTPEDSDAESDEEALLTELRLGLGSISRFERQTTAPSPSARGPEIDFLGSPSRERDSRPSADDNARRNARVGGATLNGVSDADVGAALAVNRWDSAAIGQLAMDFLASEDDGSSSPAVRATICGLDKSQSFGCKPRSAHARTTAAATSSKPEPKLQHQGSFGRPAALVFVDAPAVKPSEALAPSPPARCPKPGSALGTDKRAASKASQPAPFRGQEGALQALKRAASESILFRGGPADAASAFPPAAPVAAAAPWISEAEIGAMVVQALKRQRRDSLMRSGHGAADILQGLF